METLMAIGMIILEILGGLWVLSSLALLIKLALPVKAADGSRSRGVLWQANGELGLHIVAMVTVVICAPFFWLAYA